MGRCELFISVVPPTSAASKSHVDKLLSGSVPAHSGPFQLSIREFAEENPEGWYVHQKIGGFHMPDGHLCRTLLVSCSMGGGEG